MRREGHTNPEALRATVATLRAIDAGRPLRAEDLFARVSRGLHDLLGGLTVAYRPAREIDDWLVASDGTRSRAVREGLARTATSAPSFFAYDPIRPSALARNVSQTCENELLPPDARSFFSTLGHQLGQSRVLICDGPILLAWIGLLRPLHAARGHEARILGTIGRAVRRGLRLALGVPRHLAHATFEASIDAYPGEAYLLHRGGRVEYANGLGAALLAADGNPVKEQLRARVSGRACRLGEAAGFAIHPIRGLESRYVLATRLCQTTVDLEARLRDAAKRWALSPRRVEVLRLLALGDANKEIASRMKLSARTVEDHVAGLMARAKVESRLRLIARLWAGG